MELSRRKSRNSSKLDHFDIDSSDGKATRRKSGARMPSSLLDRLASTPGFVDKPSVEVEGDSLARRRTPRMASLNAAAKVNLFFEPSSPLAGRSMNEIQHHATRRKSSLEREMEASFRNGTGYVDDEDDDIFENNDDYVSQEISSTSDGHFQNELEVPKENQIKSETKTKSHIFTNGNTIIGKLGGQKRKFEPDSTSEGVKRSRKKFDINNMLFQREQQLGMECDTTTDPCYKTMVDACIQVDLPRPTPLKHIRVLSVPIKGQIYTSSGSIPFTKSHLVAPGPPAKPPIEHTLSKKASTKRTASLNAQAMLNAMMSRDGPLHKYKSAGNFLAQRSKYNKSSKENVATKLPKDYVNLMPLRIPKINFAATSTSNFSVGRHRPAGNPIKSIYLKNLNMDLEKLQADYAREPRKHKVIFLNFSDNY